MQETRGHYNRYGNLRREKKRKARKKRKRKWKKEEQKKRMKITLSTIEEGIGNDDDRENDHKRFYCEHR
ncbi:hypothetical protein HZH66_009289 [Vespula vulgaris]|uniref:Uncharacterized protein n=1 Tax=Vespula vulgaris TaxID=7454 RepID=A0A834JQ04_VESVU|nr:hypothetical protein HZH66_009289 [Vespula vulgaris]